MARLNEATLKRLRDTVEAEREVGDPKVATAIETLLDWHDAGDRVVNRRTYRHVKQGTTYTVVADAELQTARPLTEGAILRVYRGADGRFWVRPADEFLDGRFEEVEP